MADNSVSPRGVSPISARLGPVMQLARLIRDRRGAASMIFAVSAMGFLGLVGLATEAGYWYMMNRKGQNAADAAAIAGAMTYASTGNSTSTLNAARDEAIRNGYTSGGLIIVTPSRPPTMGSYTGNNSAVEVIVNQTQTISLSRLFQSSTTRVSNRAVAAVSGSGKACVLALTGDLTLTGNTTVTANNCMIAGNNNSATCINIGGSAYANVLSARCVGGCSGCSNTGHLTVQNPYAAYTSPTVDPFKALAAQTWPSYTGGSQCDNTKIGSGANLNNNSGNVGNSTGTYYPTYSNSGFNNTSGKAYCSQLHMQAGDTIHFTPGIYVFYNAPIKIDGGTLDCIGCTDTNGVHIVQIDPGGQTDVLDINASAAVTLSAGTTVPSVSGLTPTTSPALSGVLFYRTADSQNSNGSEVTINGGASTTLSGGFYFPNADATYNGNSSSACTIIVGGSVTLSGTSTLNQNGCSSIGTPVATTQVVALVE